MSKEYSDMLARGIKTNSISGVRDIPVPSCATASAIYLREHANGFVMPSAIDGPMNSSTWQAHYKAAIQAIDGVRFLPPHCCRHTYITMLHASGVDLNTIQTLAGQSSDEAARGYMHIKDEVTGRAVSMFEQTRSEKLGEEQA